MSAPRALAAGALSCGKTRQSLLPYTCIERLKLRPPDDRAPVERVEMQPIICAGL